MDWETTSFVLSSNIRLRILLELRKGVTTPTRIAHSIGEPLSHVSKTLGELQAKRLAICQTPDRRKARLYDITHLGNSVLDEINRITRR